MLATVDASDEDPGVALGVSRRTVDAGLVTLTASLRAV
jgi:hypothetical protein